MAAGGGAILARLAPMLARVAGPALGGAARGGAGAGLGAAIKGGAIQGVGMGVAGRVANMVQGQKDGQSNAPQYENMNGYVPGRGA